MENKTGLITPFLMLTAGTIASIIMYIRKFDLNTMLWGLLIVLVIFYILGDIARYLYASVRPRIIPSGSLAEMVEQARRNGDLTGSVVAFADDEEANEDGDFAGELSADGLMSEEGAGYSGEEGYSEEELAQDGQEDADAYDYEGEYADEN